MLRPKCLAAGLIALVLSQTAFAANAENTIKLTAEQSIGGTLITFADGSKGVTLEKTSPSANAKDPAITWKLASPLAAGWWHGTIDFGPREGDDRGWVNTHLGFVADSGRKPLVNLMANYPARDKPPFRFSFWIYIAEPAPTVHLEGVYDQLWKYKRSWPLTQVTLERSDTAPPLQASDPVTLELPVKPDGSVPLPATLPPGNWSLHAAMTKEGTMICRGEDGRDITAPFSFDRWNRPASIYFYADSPVKQLSFKTGAMFKSIVLEHNALRPEEPLAPVGPLATTVDASKTESAQLELIGTGLGEKPPTFATFPAGKKIAVLTTWDDGAVDDLRCAQILAKHGYHATFFMNQNSAAMKFLDKLEGLGAEIGSHCYHHPSLYAIPPKRAEEECVVMRQLLEKQLGHPVVSMAYPNGYTAAYDADGDYVLRAVKAAGHWSGRTTLTANETLDSLSSTDPLTLKTNGFFGDTKGLEKAWADTHEQEGTIFYFWGHSWQIGKTDEQWQKFDDFVKQFAHDPQAWYASQGELYLWIWARKNVQIKVTDHSAQRMVVTLSRPWLHPYLAEKCPLSLRVPQTVQKVLWQGKEVPVKDGAVELSWSAQPDKK